MSDWDDAGPVGRYNEREIVDNNGKKAPYYSQYPHYGHYGYGTPYGRNPNYGATPEMLGSLDIFRLIRVAKRKWFTLALTMAFFLLAGAFYLLKAEKIYSAYALIELSVRRPRILAQQSAVIEDGSLRSEEVFNTKLEKLKSESILQAALLVLRKNHPDLKEDDAEMKGTMKSDVKFTLLRRTQLVKIEAEHTDPQMAADVCRAFAQAAQETAVNENRMDSDAAVAWLKNQAESQRAELEKADQALLKFRQENQVNSLESRRKTAEESILDFNKELTKVESERDVLLSKYTAKHPQVESINKAVISLKAQIDKNSKLISDLELRIVENNIKQAELERTREACDKAYMGILNRIEEARLAADENTATIKVSEWPVVPEEPVKPRPLRIIALMFILGGVTGLGLALVTDTLEDYVTDVGDVEVLTDIKILAAIPHERKRNRAAIAKAAVNEKFSLMTESFAGLASMLDTPQYKDVNVILLTSSIPAEGKTITACNLALTLAKNGKKTLLIDFDIRIPRICGIFTMPPNYDGLIKYLDNPTVSITNEIIYETELANLHVVGTRPDSEMSPSEMVTGSNIADLMKWARKNYDKVVLDAPPLGIISDAIVLAGVSDMVLLAVRPWASKKHLVVQTVIRLREAGVNLISAVVNDVRMEKSSHYKTQYHYAGRYVKKSKRKK